MAGDEPSASSSDPSAVRTRPLTLKIYGVERPLGQIRTSAHTDLRTYVMKLTREANGRGKPIEMRDGQLAIVDGALRDGGVFGGGCAELEEAVKQWRIATRADCGEEGINKYYDEWRSREYDRELSGPQRTLTHRCYELTGCDASTSSPLVLDLGCGSGLSMQPLASRGVRGVIGVDLSIEMLKVARRQHGADAETDPVRIEGAARAEGFEGTALVLDQPHHTSGRRWFVSAARGPKPPPRCCAMHAPFNNAACLLTLQEWAGGGAADLARVPKPLVDAEHLAWLEAEHVRQAHKWIRLLRRVEELEQGSTAATAEDKGEVAAAAEEVAAPQAVEKKRGKKRKHKGLLFPGNGGGGSAANVAGAMSEAERQVARALRSRLLGDAAVACPPLDELLKRSGEVIDILHSLQR